ncbi:SDR family NAD(P)-dependent oxidoreductase [Mycobacterium sp. pUA109]|uniref:SDR family NAD(P)-dependent oxidoreductase n=1 Tax=Mycobacterium sp. pUA109 TaxID=3238982 RepID=UPI00351B5110
MEVRVPTAVVTGAGNGIGQAISQQLAAAGADVIVVDRDAEAARGTADTIGGRAVVCDVSDERSVAELAAAVDSVDVLVNNAGIWRSATLDDSTVADIDAVLGTNVRGTWLVTRALAPKFGPAGGTIVNLASVLATVGGAGRGIYPASKAALVALTKQMALEYAGRKLRVNAVGPGLVLTEGTAGEFGDAGLRDAIGAAMPLGRLGKPDDIAAAVAFLASDAAAYITGQVLYVDGGLAINGSAFIGTAIEQYFAAPALADHS